VASLDNLAYLSPAELVEHRYAKFRKMGNFFV
jgi:acetyl-CoA carboxylase alpha subunit